MVNLPHEYRNRNTERVRLWDWEWDMDENIVYGKGLPLEKSIYQINEDIGYFCHKITIVENGWETLLFV